MRSGSAYAQNAYVHWKDDGRFWFRESVSIWIWGFFIPLALLLLAPFTAGLTLLGGVGLYVFQAYRVYKYRRGFHEDTHEDARLYATYCVLGKFPQMVGQLKFLSKRESALIEYKSPETTVKPAKITPSEPISSSNGHTSTLEKQFFAETKTEVTEPIDEA